MEIRYGKAGTETDSGFRNDDRHGQKAGRAGEVVADVYRAGLPIDHVLVEPVGKRLEPSGMAGW